MLKKILKILCLVVFGLAAYILYWASTTTDITKLPTLQSGDLIFQTSLTNQTPAIVFATGSLLTHVGIVQAGKEGYTVIHARGTVKEDTLEAFANRAVGGHLLILRYPNLSPEQRERLVADARSYLGREYDRVFSFNNEAIYCSELPHLVFEAQQLPLGRVQRLAELDMDNWAVRGLFSKRWRHHPACQSESMTEAECWNTVMDEKIITPASIAEDASLTRVYSNY
ncbi:MAG: peptidoglycan peptidase [Alphaproteobacteria bacterium]|nr:peptidoglycan peptidase [Alphaproteobacteria bacterium]